jgi:hypothetical protein
MVVDHHHHQQQQQQPESDQAPRSVGQKCNLLFIDSNTHPTPKLPSITQQVSSWSWW